MAVLEPENPDNLFSLYQSLDNLYEGVTVLLFDGFKVVHARASVWPNVCFGVDPNKFDDALIDSVTKEMAALKLRPTILLPYDPGQVTLLKQKGYYPVDQWVGMSYNLVSSHLLPATGGGKGIFFVDGMEEINQWAAVVGETLFEKNPVDAEMFGRLQMIGAKLVGIKAESEWAGTAMIYFDERDIAGIYMVGVRAGHRNKGLGKALINYCLGYLRERSAKKCYLQATKMGAGLYKSLGFKESDKYLIYCKIK